jgi:dienelactone hydrolase
MVDRHILLACVILAPAASGAVVSGPPARASQPVAYCRADLPPLLERLDGTPVRDAAGWASRREEIRRLMCRYFVGTFPESVPKLVEAEVLDERRGDNGSTRRRVRLVFDTPHKAAMEIRVWTPPGDGPWPVLLTAPRWYQIDWAEMALARGYLVCLYPGVDSHHQEKDYPGYERVWEQFRAEYPEATWTEISTKAWLASRALDYLLDPKQGYPVAKGRVGIIGFSRYGKQSLIAAAFDERITAVVARSPGSPGSCPYRFSSNDSFAESPNGFPDLWFLPSLREYVGREHELPIDAHGWLGLIAPRRCLIHVAYHDDSEPTFAVERAYLEGREVYRLLGKPENLRIRYREGTHEPVTDEHRRENLDWLDLSFGRGAARQEEFPEEFIHQFDPEAWKAALPEDQRQSPFASPRSANDADRRARLLWALGREPQRIERGGRYTLLSDAESAMMSHDRWQIPNTARMPVSFGENVRGNLYFNPNVKTPAPVVIWLHPFSYGSGYNEGYGVEDTTIYHRLASEGFVVLAFDQCGFGLRLLEGRDFYKQYPRWSKLGRMVHDVRRAVDFLVDGKGATKDAMPPIRKDRVYVLGYALGGMVGLYATALDERIAGVASFCGFTPLRTDTPERPSGGIERLWRWHSLEPLLGLFAGRQEEIPYDYDDVLALVAPRPCLVYSPRRDRMADFDDVVACVAQSRKAWQAQGRPNALTHLTPNDVNRFQAGQQRVFLEWLREPLTEPPK